MKNFDRIIDGLQNLLLWMVIIIVVLCVIMLILFDVLVGAGVMLYLTNNNITASVGISMATSGLLLALMFVGYTMSAKKSGYSWIVLLFAGAVYVVDIYFDSLTADYLRFGAIVSLKTLPAGDVQILFRTLIGGISTIGETLAVLIILGMPVLKDIIRKALPEMSKSQSKPYSPPYHSPTDYSPTASPINKYPRKVR